MKTVALRAKVPPMLAAGVRLGLEKVIIRTGKWDVALGASGYSVMIGDALVLAGRMESASSLMHSNIIGLLKNSSPRKSVRKGALGAIASPYLTVQNEVRLRVIGRIMAALEPHGIRPFLAFGTLLGKEREGGFMAHDGDLDMGVLTTEGDVGRVQPLLEKAGFTTLVSEGRHWPCRLKLTCTEGVPIDMVFFHPDGGHLLTYGGYLGHRLIRKRTSFNLREDLLLNTRVWVPDPPSAFLDENYGEWRQPVDFYHYILSSKLTDHSLPIVRYCALRVLFRHLTLGNYTKAAALVRQRSECGHDAEVWKGISEAYRQFILRA